jgi:predicted lipoprotein with Yx(FWY)xxD motif
MLSAEERTIDSAEERTIDSAEERAIDSAEERPVTDHRQQTAHPQRRRRPTSAAVLAVGAVLAAVVSFAAAALAAGTPATVGSASSSSLNERVAVNAQGRTLYALSPETAHHLLCASKECLKVWPALTVHSRKAKLKAGPGVQGHLGILRRSDGLLQVTLRGLPLYRFSHDHAKGEANGQGIESFGGTWHAVSAATSSSSPKPTAPSPQPEMPTTPTTTTTPGYGY